MYWVVILILTVIINISCGSLDHWSSLNHPTGLSLETLPQLYNENALVTGSTWENVTNPFSGNVLLARSARLPSLCSHTFQGVCSCENGIVKCACIEGLPSLDFSLGTFSLPDREDLTTLMISGCQTLTIGNIFTGTLTSIHINTLVIFDIGNLVLKIDALTFTNSTTVVMGNIKKIEMRKNAVGHNLENLAILDSTLDNPYPMAFSLVEPFKKLYLEKVRLTRVNTRGLMKTLFNFKTKLSKLDVKNCSLGHVNYTLFKGESFFVNITNNDIIVDDENAIVITADNLEFTNNDVLNDNLGATKFKVLRTLHFLNNKMTNKDQEEGVDVLHLTFGIETMERVKIQKSILGRIRAHFLDVDVRHIEISDCSMKLDNENIFNINAETVIFKDNDVHAVVTEAINITVADHADLVQNYFEHLQRESFYFIQPTSNMTRITFSNNTFENFELGFLKINSELLGNNEGPRIVFENLTLKKSCDCTLSHNIICSDSPDVPGRGGRSIHGYHDHHDQHTSFEELLNQNIYCYYRSNITNLFDYKSTECSEEDLILTESAGRMVDGGASGWMWTGVVLGVVCLVVIAVLIVFRAKTLEQQMSRRAVDRFIVPATLSKEGPVDPMEQAAYWEPGSLPDLLAAIPASLANSRKNSQYDNNISEEDAFESDRSNTVPGSRVDPVTFRDLSLMVPTEPALYDSMVIHQPSMSAHLVTEL